ncbi:MAG: tetraacyldisaccharide 4'-kinase, partial [Pseudomonadota bacterium]
HTAADVGDEALMLTDSGESWIGRSRPHAVEAMAAAGVDVVIMDDGHQNPSLEKTLSLVAIDSAAPFGNGYCLPKGPLREPVAGGLSRSDAVLIVGDGPIPRLVLESGKPVLRARLQPTTKAPQGPLVAFAGIGRPQKFFDSLKNAGAQVAEGVGYGDHQTYSPSDLSFLSRLAEDHEARLITTEKDFARLPSSQRDSILIWPIEAAFEDPSALDGLVAVALQTLQS